MRGKRGSVEKMILEFNFFMTGFLLGFILMGIISVMLLRNTFSYSVPHNATNGDIIKSIFPNASFHYHKAEKRDDDYVSVSFNGNDKWQDYSREWWDDTYSLE